ncbi:MAG TPA: N-acetylneuraminate synthase family protein [Candidatus Krumholzibacteria bacterium]|nr:N-acetylneuraminate synthase family protein [Candidatus Krumholzibacteria bacterium]
MSHTYIIAEVGQNHNGDMDVARQLIDVAGMPVFDHFSGARLRGVDAVKFTKRDLNEEMTSEAANKPYTSPHAFGATYIEHRRALELSIDQHAELEQYAHARGLEFIETLCSPGCLELLSRVKVDAIKIASRDVTNIPLLEALGDLPHRIIVSTGMCTLDELKRALQVLSKREKRIDILHCLSQYPADYAHINLRSIAFLKKEFPRHVIGYSDHSIGIVVPAVAVGLGAEIIEKHITLNHNMKGSDHRASLEPDGLWRVVRDIRNVELSLGKDGKEFDPVVQETRNKLGRSLALSQSLHKGDVLEERFLCMLSPGTGLPWEARESVVGRRATRELAANALIQAGDFE